MSEITIDRDSDAYHLQSLKSAFLREQLGGVHAAQSGLGRDALDALMSRGYSPKQIADLLSKTDESGVGNG